MHRHLLEGMRGLATSESTVVSDTPAPSEKPTEQFTGPVPYSQADPTASRAGRAPASVMEGLALACGSASSGSAPSLRFLQFLPSSPVSSTLHGGRGHRAGRWLIKDIVRLL